VLHEEEEEEEEAEGEEKQRTCVKCTVKYRDLKERDNNL
jgi:hypothetical protein